MALQLRNFARGIDERPVIAARAPAKSYGEQETFAADTTDEEFLKATLRRMADKLMAKVREDGKSVRTVTVKVRYNDMDEQQASESLEEPTDIETDIYSKTSLLLRKAWQRRVSLRLVSLKLSNIYEGRFWGGLALDASARKHDGQQRLSDIVDQLRQKFGHTILLRGHDFILRLKQRHDEEPGDKSDTSAALAAPFPLTPALSLGQRENRIPSIGKTERFNLIKTRAAHPPLPQGEGRGEGEQSSKYPHHTQNEISRPATRAQLKESPAPYQLAVAQRQRLGKYAFRQSPETRAQQTVTSAERFSPGIRSSRSKVQGSKFSATPHLGRPLHCIPLNVHSYYSFLDSTLSPKAIIDMARRYELPAIALTDKNNLHGAVEFAQAAAQAGIKPIIGAELDWNGHPLCLYVENQTGYRNLCRILNSVSAQDVSGVSHTRSSSGASFPLTPALSLRERESRRLRLDHSGASRFFERRNTILPLAEAEGRGEGKPSVQSSMLPLFKCTDGLLAVSADPKLASFFPGRFYFEVTSPDDFEKRPTPLPCTASFPVHYEIPSDRWKYDIIQSILTLTLLRQQHPEKRLDGQYHFRTTSEMQKLFAAHPEALAHSREIAERCSFNFSLGKPQFPGYRPPDGLTPAVYLRQLVMEGLKRRYPTEHARHTPQLEQELAIITAVGYEEYFLVMWDILQECRRRGIEWITRGSAADSLACYCLEISGVCPIRFDLCFRRFLNKDRMALNKLPDIDVDFPHDRKDDVIDLIFEKYGPSNTAIVGGFSTFQSRSAFAEIAKVLGVSEFQVRRITERLPHFSRATELAEAVAITQECRDLPFQEEPYRTALQLAAFLDGFPRYPKMHPCGLVLSRQPMDEVTPCFISAKGYPTTHFDMDSIEAVGLIKMDILAQGGLAVMRDVIEMIGFQNPKSKIGNPKEIRSSKREDNLHCETSLKSQISVFGLRNSVFGTPPGFPTPMGPWNDAEIWRLIASGNARAVHHIESPAMISLCKMCNVQDIDTLIAIVSVIRPGAANESKKMEFARRYQGLSPVRYPHPSLKDCLRSTYGLVVYEEHILQICESFAGLPPGRADVLRRALAKHKIDVINQIQIEFAECARKRGRTETDITDVWNLVAGFSGYAFCKAHSTAYGVEAYQAAWLKHHYPAQFMAAVLTNGKGFYAPLVYILECHRLGIPLLPPSINEPGPAFTVIGTASNASDNGGNWTGPFHFTPALSLGEMENSILSFAKPGYSVLNETPTTALPFPEPCKIRVPLLNVKGLTQRTRDSVLRERQRDIFSSLADFFLRVQPLPEEMESLIRVGAFDEFGKPRTAQYWEYRSLNHSTLDTRRALPTALTQAYLFPPADLTRQPSVPLAEPDRLQRLRDEEEFFGYPVSGHPLELFPEIAWDTYCPINRLGNHVGEQIVTCGLVIEQRLFHQVTGEPMKFLTIADRTGIVETELFARTYKSYGLNTVRYRVLELAATVEPFENGGGFTLPVLRAGKPRQSQKR